MPLTDLATQKLKNSYQLRNILCDIKVPQDCSMVSFDVKSLFTSIPIDYAIEAITEFIETKNCILDNNNMIQLIKICLESTIFMYNNILYKQI